MEYHIAMIEDDAIIAEMLVDYLAQFNIKVEHYEDPFLGMSALEIKRFDLLLLDLSLPGIDGLEVLKRVRKRHSIPIIITSARSDLDDKVVGLELGADDYLAKPFEPKELYARIMSNIRRYKSFENGDNSLKSDFEFNEAAFEVLFKKTPLHLTQAETEIMAYLIKKHGCAISREELIAHAPSLREGNQKSIEVLIGRIRQKIGDNAKNPKYIQSIRGIGYKLIN